MPIAASLLALLFPLFSAHAEIYFGVFKSVSEESRHCNGDTNSPAEHARHVLTARRDMRRVARRDLNQRLRQARPESSQVFFQTFRPLRSVSSPEWSYGEVDHREEQAFELEALVFSRAHAQVTPRRLNGLYLALSADGLHSDFELDLEPEDLDVTKSGRLHVRLGPAAAERVRSRIRQGGIEYVRLHLRNQHGLATAGGIYEIREVADFLRLPWYTRAREVIAQTCAKLMLTSKGS